MKRLHNTHLFHCLSTTLAVLALGFSGCNRLDIPGMIVNRSDTEERVAEWLDWDNQNEPFVINDAPDDYCVYSCSDAHINDDNSRLAMFITTERNDDDAIFSILAGDIANESGERPFILCDSALAYRPEIHTKNDPCFPIIGNHDVYYDCAKYFQQHYHTSTYTLTVNTVDGNKDLFIFLDSGNGTHGSRQLEWLEEQLAKRSDYRHCIVISHNWMFRTTYNYTTTPAANLPEDEQYAFMDLMSRNDVDMVLMGHFHYSDVKTFAGVKYVMTNNLNEEVDTPSYLVLHCNDEISFEYRDLAMPEAQ